MNRNKKEIKSEDNQEILLTGIKTDEYRAKFEFINSTI